MSENQLLKNVTYEKLYQNDGQNIWFLAWILQQLHIRIPDFNQQILSVPFTVKRHYLPNGQLRKAVSQKNDYEHGILRTWGNGNIPLNMGQAVNGFVTENLKRNNIGRMA